VPLSIEDLKQRRRAVVSVVDAKLLGMLSLKVRLYGLKEHIFILLKVLLLAP